MKVISFYSFKGGAGRTVTSMNVAAALANSLKADKNNPILVIDGDIDSSGSTILMGAKNKYTNSNSKGFASIVSGETKESEVYSEIFERKNKVPLSEKIKEFIEKNKKEMANDYLLYKEEVYNKSFVDKFEEKIDNNDLEYFGKNNFREFMYEHETNNTENALLDISYKLGNDKLGSIQFLGTNSKSIIEIEKDDKITDYLYKFFKNCRKSGYKAVIIDCASGFQDIAQSTLISSTDVMLCSKITTQFREGTCDFINEYFDIKKQFLAKEDYNQRIHILPTIIPENIDDFYERKITLLRNGVADVKGQISLMYKGDRDKTNTMINRINTEFLDSGGIGEVNLFKWEEGILNKIIKTRILKEDETKALTAYKKVAVYLSNK